MAASELEVCVLHLVDYGRVGSGSTRLYVFLLGFRINMTNSILSNSAVEIYCFFV